jgi:hypothetical protein
MWMQLLSGLKITKSISSKVNIFIIVLLIKFKENTIVYSKINKGYSYGINSPIILQILQLESHDSQLSGAKTEHFYLVLFKFYCKGNTKKLIKIKKGQRTVKRTVKKIYTFLQISQEPVVIS